MRATLRDDPAIIAPRKPMPFVRRQPLPALGYAVPGWQRAAFARWRHVLPFTQRVQRNGERTGMETRARPALLAESQPPARGQSTLKTAAPFPARRHECRGVRLRQARADPSRR